eukprot:4463675-Pleurochrysis_carterae.AAC.4
MSIPMCSLRDVGRRRAVSGRSGSLRRRSRCRSLRPRLHARKRVKSFAVGSWWETGRDGGEEGRQRGAEEGGRTGGMARRIARLSAG